MDSTDLPAWQQPFHKSLQPSTGLIISQDLIHPIFVLQCFCAWIYVFTDPQICFSGQSMGEMLGIIHRFTNNSKNNLKMSQGSIPDTFFMDKKY